MFLPLWILRRMQMPIGRKLGLAALFSIAITDVIVDITRTVYTVHGSAFDPYTVWDILEPTIAVIVSSLPTYKALLGGAKKERNTRYQNLGPSGGVVWHNKSSNNANETNGVELSKNSTRVPEAWPDYPLQRCTEAVKTTEVVWQPSMLTDPYQGNGFWCETCSDKY